MNNDIIQQWKRDEQAQFEGWDFSYVKTRFKEDVPPWNYIALAKEKIRKASSLLDIDTGGGEVLSSLSPFPNKAFATEEYIPNVSVAQKRLEPLGVKVVAVNSRKIPFEDSSFNLIINRHGGLDVGETFRVLEKGGTFLTQQVSGDNWIDLVECFQAKKPWPDNILPIVRKKMETEGFTIERAEEWRGKVTFSDVGAIVYLLKATPWTVEGFSVDTHLNYLLRLQERVERGDKLEFRRSLFLVEARKL